jgi:hypothetical protein
VAANVFVDLTGKEFVASSKGGEVESPYGTPFHQDKIHLNIQPLDLSTDGSFSSSPYETLDASGYSISLLVTKAADGTTLAGPATSWTPNGTALVGSIDLTTAAMNTAVTALSAGGELATYFWLQISDGNNRKVTLQTSVTVKKSAITTGTPTEYPLEQYLTASECMALFVKYANNPDGATIILTSPDGSEELELGVNDDGTTIASGS